MGGVLKLVLRLFISLVAAKFFLRLVGVADLGYLLGLTLLLTGNIYLFDFLEYGDRRFLPPAKALPPETGEPQEDSGKIALPEA
ncbi:MAG: hypothetical protein AB1491_06755 [Thermodesulfobacteriota bacterium]